MKLGLAVPAYRRFAERDTMLKIAQVADEHGYYSTWVPDHLATLTENDDFARRLGVRWFDPYIFMASVAARTKRVRLGIGVVVLPFRHPLVIAKTLATLDVMSEGRLIVGVGTGHHRGEFDSLGLPLAERGPISDEYLAAIKELWTSDRPQFEGKYVRFKDIIFEPKPVQSAAGGHPPIWVGGNSNPAKRRAVTLGTGWHPLALSPAKLAPEIETLKVMAARRQKPLPFISVHGEWIRIAGVGAGPRPGPERLPLNGTPEQLVEDIQAYEALGVGHLVLRFGAAESLDEFLAALDVFEQKVRPHVHED